MQPPRTKRFGMATKRPRIVTLGFSQYAALCGALAATLVVAVLLGGFGFFGRGFYDFYVERFALKHFEAEYGFETGVINVQGPDGGLWGITHVASTGVFAKLGVEAGDIPFDHHGHGGAVMYDALLAASAGRHGSFEVINVREWPKPKTLREIRVPPR